MRQEKPKVSFNERWLSSLKAPDERTDTRDSKTKGLGWQRFANGKTYWKTLGNWPELSLDNARAAAEKLNSTLANWKAAGYPAPDPFEKKAEPSSTLTFGDLFDRYIEARQLHKQVNEKTLYEYKRIVKAYLEDWKTKELRQITDDSVAILNNRLAKKNGPIMANRVTQLLRAIFAWAITSKPRLWTGTNPAKLPKGSRFQEREVARCLTPEELTRLYAALDSEETSKDLREFVELSLETGQRKGNILGARWAQINLDAKTFTIPSAQAKNKKLHVVMLRDNAVKILRARQGNKSVWVFPAEGDTEHHLLDLKKGWSDLLVRAGLDYPKDSELHLRQHDLRHTHISYLVMGGASLQAAGATVGHVSSRSTERYTHLLERVQREVTLAGQRKMERMIAEAKKKQPILVSRVMELPAPK